MKMIADQVISYRGVRYRVGDELDVEDVHVGLFKRIGFAHVASESNGMTYGTRMMTADVLKRKRGRPRKNPVA